MKTNAQLKSKSNFVQKTGQLVTRSHSPTIVPEQSSSGLDVATPFQQSSYLGHSFEQAEFSPESLQPITNGQPLPKPLREKMESAFDTDFSNVRVHEDGNAAKIGALAYTKGTHLHFAPGQFRPHSSEGQKLIGHELTHVIQQRARRFPGFHQADIVHEDIALEAEAETLGLKAAQGMPIAVSGAIAGEPLAASNLHANDPVQCAKSKKDMSTAARLKRAKQRYEKRRKQNKSETYFPELFSSAQQAVAGAGVEDVATPFGPVNFFKFPTKDPGAKVTTVKKKYKGKTVGHKYTEMTKALVPTGTSEKDVATELMNAIETPKTGVKRKAITDPEQENAAAKLVAIAHSSEPLRVGGTSKGFRAAIRGVKAGAFTFDEALTSDNPLFPMAVNPNKQRRLVNYEDKKLRKPPEAPPKWNKLADYMSDSSDEEDDS